MFRESRLMKNPWPVSVLLHSMPSVPDEHLKLDLLHVAVREHSAGGGAERYGWSM